MPGRCALFQLGVTQELRDEQHRSAVLSELESLIEVANDDEWRSLLSRFRDAIANAENDPWASERS